MHPKKYSSSNCVGLVKAISGTTSLLQSRAYNHQRPYLAILATYMAIMAIEAADTWYVFSLEVRSLSHIRDLSYQKKLRFIRHTPQLSTSSSSSATVAPVAFSRLDLGGRGVWCQTTQNLCPPKFCYYNENNWNHCCRIYEYVVWVHCTFMHGQKDNVVYPTLVI